MIPQPIFRSVILAIACIVCPSILGAQAAGDSPAPAAPLVQTVEPPVATYHWPENRSLVPLEARVGTTFTDGFAESVLYLSGSGLRYQLRAPNGFAVTDSGKDTSCRLVSRQMPRNRLDFFLFQPGSFLPGVNQTTLRGYRQGLEKDHGEAITIDYDPSLIPDKTFSVLRNRWGQLHYRLETPDEETLVSEFFIPLDQRLLVIRLAGTDSFVTAQRPRIIRMISTLSRGEQQPDSPAQTP